jgi:hypothetical protein
MVNWNEFLKRGHQFANVAGYMAASAVKPAVENAYQWMDAKVPQIPIVGQAYQGLSSIGDPQARAKRQDEIRRATEATKIYDASKKDNAGLAKSQFSVNTGNLASFIPTVAGLGLNLGDELSNNQGPLASALGGALRGATKKKEGEKFVELKSWVHPKQKVKIQKHATKLQVTQSTIIRQCIEEL